MKETIHKWKDGDVLEGIYKGFEKREFDDGTRRLHTILRPDGLSVSVWETLVLKRHLDKIRPGRYIRIEYEGEKQGQGNRTYKAFDVSVDKAEDEAAGDDIPF